MNVSACLVTRGNVQLDEIVLEIKAAGIEDIVIWDNSQEVVDVSVYGRYAAIERAKHDYIYVQDDDCILDRVAIDALVLPFLHGALFRDSTIIANMPPEFRHDFYVEHCLVGFGAVFHRDLPFRAFERLAALHGEITEEFPRFFWRTCDIPFTVLTPFILANVPKMNLPWATDEDRMYRQPEHVAERKRMLELSLSAKKGRE